MNSFISIGASGIDQLPLPEILLVYGQAQALLQPEERLFQWHNGTQQRICCVADIPAAQAALQALQNQPFLPVMIFDQGESRHVLAISRHDLPNFAIIDAENEPDAAEYALFNPEVDVEALWYKLLDGEALAAPPAIWHDAAFLSTYSTAFMHWLLREPDRYSLEPLVPLALDDFQTVFPQADGYHLAHQGFPLAWLRLQHAVKAHPTPGGVLESMSADALYFRQGNREIALAEVPGEVWAGLLATEETSELPNPEGTNWFDKLPKLLGKIWVLLEEEIPKFPALAATDSKLPFSLKSLTGKWSVTWEVLTNDLQMLMWVCREEHEDNYVGKQVIAEIGGDVFDLGEISQGIAEKEIPLSLDLNTEPVTIRIVDIKRDMR